MSQRNLTHNKSPCKGRVLRTLGRIPLTLQHIKIRSVSADTRYRWTKWGPHTLTARKLFPSCLFPQLTWPVLFSQARTDPGEILPRVICLCDLLGKLLCSSHHCLSFHLQGDALPVCDTGRFPSKVIPPSHRFSSDGPRQSRTAQTSCLAAYFAVSPCFSTVVGLQSCFFFFFLQDYEKIVFTCH